MDLFRSVFAAALSLMLIQQVGAADFLADRHQTKGVTCQNCHPGNGADGKVALPDRRVCLTCHVSDEALAAKTAKLENNPHKTHLGAAECTACHQGHKPPRLVCEQCHDDVFSAGLKVR